LKHRYWYRTCCWTHYIRFRSITIC